MITLTTPEAIAAMTNVRLRNAFPCKERRRNPLSAYLVRVIIELSQVVSAIDTEEDFSSERNG